MLKKLRLEEILAIFVFFVIFLLAIVGHKPLFENIEKSVLSYSYISFLALFLVIYGVVIHINKKHKGSVANWYKIFDILRDWLPIFVVIVVYESLKHLHLDDIIKYFGMPLRDEIMLSIDNAIFGATPSVLMEGLIDPVFTKINEFAYDAYYFYFPILGVVLYIKGKKLEFRTVSITFIAVAYIGYIFYLLIPVAGPQFEGRVVYSSELFIFGRNAVQQTMDLLRFDLDCFPSLHTAQPLVILFFAYKYEKKLFYIGLIPISLTIFSTMYLRYHYGVDVIAGTILAITAFIFIPKLFKKYRLKYETTESEDILIDIEPKLLTFKQK